MQESTIIEVAMPAADLAAQTATYAAADAGIFAATQAAAQQSVASAAELVKSGGEAAMSAGEVALLAAEAAGATAVGVITGVALPVILGGIGVVGLGGAAYYAWTRKGWTVAEVRADLRDRWTAARAEATTPGPWPAWEGHTPEAIWNDDALLEEATRPEPSADELEIDWTALELECATR
jgi:hypothetical protein